MKSFPITAWSVKYNKVYPGGPSKIAVVYVQPTDSLIKSINNRELVVPVTIAGTESAYDGITAYGTLVPNGHLTSYMPIDTGTPISIMILLDVAWDSYPLFKGEVLIDLPGDDVEIVTETAPIISPEPVSWYDNVTEMEWNFIVLLVVLIVLAIIVRMK